METCIVLVTDQNYLSKALRTIEDIRTAGQWQNDLILITIDECCIEENIISAYNLIILNRKHIDISILKKTWEIFPIKPMDDRRHTHKLAQWNKFYVFDEYFKAYSRIIYFDSGTRIVDNLICLLDLDYKNKFIAQSDCHNTQNTFKCQMDWNANPDVTNSLLNEFNEDIMDKDYFINCIWVYDSSILSQDIFNCLIYYMNKYPISMCNEMGIMNLLFTFKMKIWTPLPIKYNNKYLFEWSDLNNKGTNYKDYYIIKYPCTLHITQSP